MCKTFSELPEDFESCVKKLFISHTRHIKQTKNAQIKLTFSVFFLSNNFDGLEIKNKKTDE